MSPGAAACDVLVAVVEPADWEVYCKHAEELVRLATVLVGPSEAEDLVANAVLRALQSRAWSGARNPRAYLVRALVNEASSGHRSRSRRQARESRAASAELGVEPVSDPDVLAAVARLSPRQRAVVYLAYWEDYSVASISTTLGISEGSVRRHLGRARDRLRKVLL